MSKCSRHFHAPLIALLLATALTRAEEPAPLPAWVARAGALRASDPALARGRGVVRWRGWNAETFAEATRTQKPIYLFVTANWCRGGQEMERSVLGDAAIANRLNTEFIPVRLDRDAFPETDLRLQQAVMATKGTRGWPLNIFLTPDGELFSGSTSLPLDDDLEFNKPGMRRTLELLAQRWSEDRFRISREAGTLCHAIKKSTEHPSMRGSIPPDILNTTVLKFQTLLDRENGGFISPVPAQFPEPRALELCLAHYARTGDKKSLEVVETTLGHILRGGIYDQLEGGFHRFATDRHWRVPRFEKQPILNAEMICILLHAWQATGNGLYRTAAEECLNFWRGELDAGGTFFSASIAPDARSFEDGAYYTWTVREIELLFSDETDIRFARMIYGIEETGNQPYSAPDRTVLTAARPLHEVARELGLDIDAARKRLERVRERMRSARSSRPPPPRDATPLCDANAMLAAVFIEGGRVLGRSEFARQGLKTLSAILKEQVDGKEVSRPLRHVLNDPKSVALAMDEAARAWACLQAYETTGDPTYKQLAADALNRLDGNYRDLLRGGYIERSFKGVMDFAPALNWRTKSIQDTSEPSTNGMIASVCVRLYALGGDAQYLERAKAAVEDIGGVLTTPSPYNATLTAAADAVQNGVLRVKIIGREGDTLAAAMLSLAQTRYFPWKTVLRFDTLNAAGEVAIANLDSTKVIAIVETKSDKLIAESMEELNKFLDDLGKSATPKP